MENKYITLQTIYDIVKNDAHPTSTIVFPNEVIVRQNFPWDESVKYLDELCSENMVEIIQLSPSCYLSYGQRFSIYPFFEKVKARCLAYIFSFFPDARLR
jgi:hypothetical protein